MTDHPKVPLIQRVKIRLRHAGVELDHTVKWHVTKTHEKPEGFHFTCETPVVLQHMAEKSGRMARDLDYPPPAGFDTLRESTVGFTEIGEGARVHIDIALEPTKLCRVFIDPDSHVVGRDRIGDALRELGGPVVERVKNVASRKGIHLDRFGCRVVRIYDNGVEPSGFDFRCAGNGMSKLLAHVRTLAAFKYDDPKDKIHGGWLNQLVTLGSGYREKGYGPRLHIELAPKENLGNVHIDSHGFARADGSYDWHEALTHHGPLDLLSGYLGGRVGPFAWLPFGSLVYMRDRDHETTVLGLPDDRITPPADGGPDKRQSGWRLTFGLRLTF